MFSNCEISGEEKEHLKKLGAIIVDDIKQDFNILVMDLFGRRPKLLVALNKSAYILSRDWVFACISENKLLTDKADEYILKIDKKD